MRSVGLLVACAACVTPPAPRTEPTSLVTATGEDNGADMELKVGGDATDPSTLTLQLGSLAHVRQPLHFRHGGFDLIAGNFGECVAEAGVGTSAAPALSVSALEEGSGGALRHNEASFLSRGPAIAQIQVVWTVSYTCHGSDDQPDQDSSGTSIYTLLPDHRLVRRDEGVIAASAPPIMHPEQCGCDIDTSDRFVTTFWTFPDGTDVGSDDGPAQDGSADSACAELTGGPVVAVTWSGDDSDPAPHVRFHPTSGNAFVYDWVHPGSDDELDASEHEVTTTLRVVAPGTRCADALGPRALPPPLLTSDTGPQSGSVRARDGLFEDNQLAHSAPVTIDPMADRPDGFGVSLNLGDASHVRVTRSGEGATDPSDFYRVQVDTSIPEDRRVIVWFIGPVSAHTQFVVEPKE